MSQMSNETKNPGWLGYLRDYTTQLYRDYCIINHYKDLYQWKVGGFFLGSLKWEFGGCDSEVSGFAIVAHRIDSSIR